MLPLEVRRYLFDIVQAADLLTRFIGGRTLVDYGADALLRAAVERQFEIIGEALRQVVRLDPSLASRISDSHRIIAFRNRLIHGYASVSNEVVWGVLEASLPTLRREVQALLEEPESAS